MKKGLAVLLWGLALIGAVQASPWQGFTSLVLSSDGRWFATGGRQGEVLWFETATGEVQARWSLVDPEPIVGLAFDPQGSSLTAVALDGTLSRLVLSDLAMTPLDKGSVPDQALTEALRSWTLSPPLVGGVRVTAGDLWAQGSATGQITVGSTALNRTLASWQAHSAAVTGLALSPDGTFVLSVAYDGTLGRWDPKTGRSLGRL